MALGVTARQTPAGRKLKRGMRMLIAFERDPDVSIWEMVSKMPGLDIGDGVPQTTQHNQDVHTFEARLLAKITDGTSKMAYDPDCYNQIRANLLGKNGQITYTLPDGSTFSFYGYLKTFEFAEMNEENMPEANATIQVTNVDPATGAEVVPVMTSVSGT